MTIIARQVKSTKHRRPLTLVYFEGCLNQQDATHREKYSPRGIMFCVKIIDFIPQGKKQSMEKDISKID